MEPRQLEEYRALRATIRERGTARLWLFLAGLVAWAVLLVATAALATLPVATLLPLLVLAAAFETVFAVHTGVERIGRYVQVFLEEEEGWEHTAMACGRAFPGGPGPLFAPFFAGATILNIVPALLAAPLQPIEWIVVGTAHLLFLWRIGLAGRAAARQRVVDLERFQQIKDAGTLSSRHAES